MKLTGNVVVSLSPLEVERLLAILMDGNRGEAISFFKECLDKKGSGSG